MYIYYKRAPPVQCFTITLAAAPAGAISLLAAGTIAVLFVASAGERQPQNANKSHVVQMCPKKESMVNLSELLPIPGSLRTLLLRFRLLRIVVATGSRRA